MNSKGAVTLAIITSCGPSALAHRLDEYLQATTLSLSRTDVQIEMRLTPGIAVYNRVVEGIDLNHDGVISDQEQRAYAQSVVNDLSLSVDGDRLSPRVIAYHFPTLLDMKKGLGEIELRYKAVVPVGESHRQLVLVNRHQSKIAAYLVNCLVPEDPNLAVTGQTRNFNQSHYRLDYRQTNPSRPLSGLGWWFGGGLAISILLVSWRRYRPTEANLNRVDSVGPH